MVVVLAPKDCERLVSVYLPNPKDFPELKQQLYYHDEDNLKLYEQVRYYDEHRSWLLGDTLQQRGEMLFMTQIDPLFIFVPILIKFSSEKYRSLDDICSSYDEVISINQQNEAKISQESAVKPSRLHYALSPYINWELVADTQQVDDEMYFKYNESKTLDWLANKFDKTMIVLESAMSEPQKSSPPKATLMSYALDLINVYLPPPLSDKFKKQAKINMLLANDTESPKTDMNPISANASKNGKRTSEYPPNKQEPQKQSATTKTKASKNASNNKADPSQASIKSFFRKK